MKKTIATLCTLVSLAVPASSEAILDCAGYTGPCEVVSVSRPWSSVNIWDYGSDRITVEKGQTLIGIAEQYLGDRKAYLRIAKRNGIEGPEYKIYAGQELILP